MSRSLVWRAVAAVALSIGFYVLAIGLVVGLLAVPVLELVFIDRIHIQLALLCVVGAGIIGWSILPRIDRFVPPGPRLAPEDHPELFTAVRAVAADTRQEMPAEVFLVGDVNAFVTERGGVMGIGSRRVMGLGLPLLEVLSVSQLRAVLAHEFGHFHGGDTKLGPWIYKTRAAIGRTVQGLAGSDSGFMQILRIPFESYGKLFLRITHAISRAQEYSADRLAARTQGARALTGGLEAVHRAALAYGPYFSEEVVPVLEAGFHPPIVGGFRHFMESDYARHRLDEALKQALESGQTDPYDTHPALKHRIAAVAGENSATTLDERPAVELLGALPAAERSLLQGMFADPAAFASLQSVAWQDVGVRVYEATWRKMVVAHGAALAGLTPATAPLDTAELLKLARTALGDQAASVPDEPLVQFARELVLAAISLLLVKDGWSTTSLPGEPIRLVRNSETIDLAKEIAELMQGRRTHQEWAARMRALGIAERSLAAAPSE